MNDATDSRRHLILERYEVAPPRPRDPMAVYGLPDETLLERAVRNARSRKAGRHPRWVAVMDTFALGPSMAYVLCRRFGFDPDEKVQR